MLCASCGKEVAKEAESADRCPLCEGPVLLAQKYRLVGILGRGANGVTYRAERIADGAVFAVKELPIGTAESVKALELFERETSVLRTLHHPAIPRHEDNFTFGEGKSTGLYLVQELIDGGTIAAEAEAERLAPADVWKIVAGLCDVLAYLHGRTPPVVHRDIKPANVMRRKDGSLVLIDFGSVRDAVRAQGGSTVAGTFGYMAPEQLAGRASPASDLYAVGAMAAALLSRKEADALLDDEGRLDVRAHASLDNASLALLDELLTVSPKDRMHDAAVLRERAEELSQEEAPGAEKQAEPSHPRESKRARKRRLRAEHEAHQTAAGTRAEPTVTARTVAAQVDTSDDEPSRQTKNRALVVVCLMVGGLVVAGLAAAISSTRTKAKDLSANASTPGAPELYARPLAVDVNGDGITDLITAVGVDEGPHARDDDGNDDWGADNGHYLSYVQAIDGKSGRVLYHLGDYGKTYSSLGVDQKERTRVVLAAKDGVLVVARSLSTSTAIDLVALSDGKPIKTAKAEGTTGAACDSASGIFLTGATSRGGAAGLLIVPKDATIKSAARPLDCSTTAVANVADAPTSEGITNRGQNPPYFGAESAIVAGRYTGRTARAHDGLGVFIEKKQGGEAPNPTGPMVSFTDNSTPGRGPDNGSILVVGVEVATGVVRWETSLASLGVMQDSPDRVDIGPAGPVLILAGDGGIVALDAKTGKARFTQPFPAQTTVAQYTLTADRGFFHVFGYGNNVIYGFLSKKLESRTLIVDFNKKTIAASVPSGPLKPRPPPPSTEPDLSRFKPIVGCTCPLGGGDAGGLVTLLFATNGWTETGERKFFPASYVLDVNGKRRALPHYNEKRERIAPPRTLEGDVPLGLACGDGAFVVAFERIATAWSIASDDKVTELWTVDLPESRGQPPTSFGGQAVVHCQIGSVAHGIARLPTLDGREQHLTLTNGSSVADAGLFYKADAGMRAR